MHVPYAFTPLVPPKRPSSGHHVLVRRAVAAGGGVGDSPPPRRPRPHHPRGARPPQHGLPLHPPPPPLPLLPTSDPYAAVVVAGNTLARTHVVRNSEDPEWSTHVLLHLAHHATGVAFHVKDADPFGSDLIGVAILPAADVLAAAAAPIVRRELPLYRPDGRGRPKPSSAIVITASFVPAGEHQSIYDAEHGGVPAAYFPARRGCEVKLYQDAHVAGGELDGVRRRGVFEPGRCWEDMCLAVLGAQHLVYVAGWSVNTKVRLVREAMSPEMAAKVEEVRTTATDDDDNPVAAEGMSLGALLKYKSQEGVRVCLLVWDDKTSRDTFFLKTGGLMQTHDEETKKFFKDSPNAERGVSASVQIVGTMYTQHQKCLLVDTPASGSTRRITAFLGGLDLAAGRYDTPSHRLFADLGTPWHDMHCRVDGPAAYDVLENFEQRWRKATKLFRRAKAHWKDDALLKLERISWILSPSDSGAGDGDGGDSHLYALPDGHPDCWNAQVFRSVDSGSVKGLPRCWETKKMEAKHLVCDKNVTVEQSIHTAYVRAIRSAKRFIYIENQYFIGSSFAWPSYKHQEGRHHLNLLNLSHHLSESIALKVASKIAAGERFAVYIVIPMWPEGVPTSGPIQEILFWQRQTMQAMYEVIAAAIRAAGMEGAAHPRDYLNFYCLGKREAAAAAAAGSPEQEHNPAASSARRHRRFMIYVHSKGMIVDDEYVIVGSANINQRSLAGSRDTEIAVGAYQPNLRAGAGAGDGQVFGFRMLLWEEHLGSSEWRELRSPESPECVKRVNEIAAENWRRYAAADDDVAMQGHLMRYPVDVGDDGKISELRGHEFFPDVGGRILGSTNNNYWDYLTM
uniref:Phospholipase D n=1 Tax=Oryza barthii TaxID=65489 RepID=A0A0D3EZX5_9ORYZ